MWSKRKLCGGCGAIVYDYPFSRCLQCRQKDELNFPNLKLSTRIRYIIEQKNKPCADCHVPYPYYVMDFDHLPEYKKEFAIGRAVDLKKSLSQIKKEIAKCELVCANCHRIRTYKRSIDARILKESELPIL